MEPTERHQLLVRWKIRYIFLISSISALIYLFISILHSERRNFPFLIFFFFLTSDQTEELMAVPYSHFSPAVVMIQKSVSTKSPSKTSGMVVMCTGNKISTPSPIGLSPTVTNKVSQFPIPSYSIEESLELTFFLFVFILGGF